MVAELYLTVDWPAWLTAVGTVGALFASLYLLRVQIMARGVEAQERRMAQARRVSAWVANIARVPERNGHFTVAVRTRNTSDQPVYGTSIELDLGVRGSFIRTPMVLGPGETREFPIEAPAYPRGFPAVSIVFTDSAGHRWLRTSTGELRSPRANEEGRFRESPGAYSESSHPTLAKGHSLEAQMGRHLE